MQFIKDLAKFIGVILGIVLVMLFFKWFVGAETGRDNSEYYLYEHDFADDSNVKNNAPWNQEIEDSI